MAVENSSSRTLHSICDSLLNVLSFTVDGRLSPLLKCSVHLFKIASLSMRSVLPSSLSSGVVPELFSHKLFSVHDGTSSCPFSNSVCKILDFFLLSQESCMSLDLFWTVL